ncbi:MAG: ABC transporter ATP-binding protein [Candidatus Jordarchaeales archaeon]
MLVTRGLTFTYSHAKKPAIKDINLEIDDGEFLLCLGPTGCGKTTICRCFNGLIPHFYKGEMRGYVKVNGLDTRFHPVYKLALNVGLVFQNPEEQIVSLTVEKELAFGLENLAFPREEMLSRLNWVSNILDLKGLMKKRTFFLSGGEQQKVVIGSVLALEPNILVLDEPTANLDPQSAEALARAVKKLNDEGVTVILTEHRVELFVQYATRVILMEEGKVLMDGKPREVLSSDEARRVGVFVKTIELYRKLKDAGLELPYPPLSLKEAYTLLKGALHDRGERSVSQL